MENEVIGVLENAISARQTELARLIRARDLLVGDSTVQEPKVPVRIVAQNAPMEVAGAQKNGPGRRPWTEEQKAAKSAQMKAYHAKHGKGRR